MGTTETFGKATFESLDLMRGVAALLVAMAHFTYGTLNVGRIAGGVSVILFFVLSGFVLRHAYGEAIAAKRVTFGRFLALRLARLYPLHFVTFAIVASYWLLMGLGKAAGMPINVEYNWTASQIFENVFLTHFWFQGSNSFNSPAWSISVELWCSFYVFLLCLPASRIFKTALIGSVVGAYALVLSGGGFMEAESRLVLGFLEKNYVSGFFYFTVGWLIHKLRTENRAFAWEPLAGAICALLLLYLTVFSGIHGGLVEPLLFGFSGVTVYLFSYAHLEGRLRVIARLFGDCSYGIYLWHVPLMLLLATAARVVEVKTGATIIGSPMMNAAYLALLPLLAWCSHRFLEMPSKRMLLRLAETHQTRTA